MKKRLLAAITVLTLVLPLLPAEALAAGSYGAYGFSEAKVQKTDEGTYHLLRHTDSGAEVLWLDNDADERVFTAGFRTPPADSKGANHVLEHALLCGSEKYPVRELMHALVNTSAAEELNAYTSDDYTCYVARTKNEADFYNLSDVFLSSVLFPLLKTEPNIFKQQGIRIEYADGKAQYNGIVFSELKLRSLDTDENSLQFVGDQLYKNLYANGTPVLDAGGAIPDILDLTYDDLMRVYNTYYKPSNMLIYVSGKQDIGKTLKMFDEYLSKAGKSAAPAIAFNSDPVAQSKTVQEYNVTASTKTVDIGFMAHGPSVLDLKKSEGWGALVTCLQKQMGEKYPDAMAYTIGGTSGGVNNVGVILSGIPLAEKEQAVQTFQGLLDNAARNGLSADALRHALDVQADAQQFGKEEAFTGFAYGGDPLACIGRQDAIKALRNDGAYFKTLAAEWRDSKYQTIVISGNGAAKPAVPTPDLSAAELEQVKRDTEAFNKWISTPDSAEAVATLPQLTASDFADDPFTLEQTEERTDGAVWHRTKDEKAERSSFSLYFPIEAKADDLAAWCLLSELLTDKMEKDGGSGMFGLISGESADDPDTLHPRFSVSGSADAGKAGEGMKAIAALLQSPPLSDENALRTFLTTRKNQLISTFSDPYQTEYTHKLRAGTQAERFLTGAPTGFYGSSLSYRDFIETALANPGGNAALLERLRGLLASALKRGGTVADFTGGEADYKAFLTAAKALLASLPEGAGASSCEFLPGGWPSALVVSSGAQDANHVMVTGFLEGRQADFAALRVLGAVMGAKYLLPELRDKRGAYGANCRFDETGVTFACSGGVPVDEVIAVVQRAGTWVRGLSLTERELNGYRLGALREYDDYAEWSRGSGANLALSGRTQDDYARERQEILAVTLNDLKACAGLVDELTAQGHVFAQTTGAAEANVKFPFACRVDAATGKATPKLKGDIAASDDRTPLTRGEMASLLAESLVDQSKTEQPVLARFTDVAPGGEQADALAKLHDRRLLNGYKDGTFAPDAKITRAEFCVIADALAVGGAADGAPAFSDVAGGYWAHGVIARMAAAGLLKGDGDGAFRPESPITRREATLILRRLAGLAA
ncbi:MAG: S-layer homology domain-containing protein [Eubacteriales bacterium]|nr:S-layer homology domain-containing protein [Eubacteriales bacterium]